MSRRGEDLRRHILWTAKELFLEVGFERASMDEVAARAETSKRSLYAHFGSKENLFLQVVEFVRELYLTKLGSPADYAEDPVEALTGFLALVVGQVLWDSVVRTCRMAIAEAERIPEAARGYHEVTFGTPVDRIAEYLVARGWGAGPARAVGEELVATLLYPRLLRALYAVEEPLASRPEGDGPIQGVDSEVIRLRVGATLARADVTSGHAAAQ